ncbi:MAG TPA: class I SAM-dependent methyltransferase [Candidatus Limnocylindrales bacterium]|nr:class I SAM-dependent methyltransferase [Candidatus Limnocylindrales bacterium]
MATFDERAAEWDSPEHVARAEAVADAFVAAVPIEPGTRAIELGAGTGLLGLAIRRRVGAARLSELLLTDASGGMLAVADSKIRDGRIAGVRTARFAVTTDPPPDGAPFDLAVSLLVLHHVEDTPAALRGIAGLLRPGGLLALSDLDTEDGSFHTAEAEGIHHLGFDRGALRDLAEAAGFEDVRLSTAGTMEREGRDYPLFLLVARRR